MGNPNYIMSDLIKFNMTSYLEHTFSNIPYPKDVISLKFLNDFGKKALEEKRLEVENSNLMLQASQRERTPKTLSELDAAVILASCLHFVNIKASFNSVETSLGVYQNDKSDPQYGLYIISTKFIQQLIRMIIPSASIRACSEVISLIETMVETKMRETSANLIPVHNGIYNKEKHELEAFSPEYVYLSKLAVDYKENPKNIIITADDGYQWDVESWIDDLSDNDPEVNTLLWQVFSDAIHGTYSRGKAIFFYSALGNNGKGTIGQLIKNLLGSGNYSSLAINDFKHEFMKVQLVDAIANIADENDVDQYIDSVRDFKASITGDDIIINGKFEKPFPYKFRGANIQMLNGLPKTRDKSDSFYRRLIIVPFLKSFTNNGERKYIKTDYINRSEVLEYVLHKALHTNFSEFIQPQATQYLLDEYKSTNNPVIQFWEELEDEFQWDLLPTQFLYDLFVSWSAKNNPMGKPMGKKSFIEIMKSILVGSTNWRESFNNPTKTSARMDSDEPLITDYQLTDWYNPTKLTRPPKDIRNFTRKAQYRGVIRLTKQTITQSSTASSTVQFSTIKD